MCIYMYILHAICYSLDHRPQTTSLFKSLVDFKPLSGPGFQSDDEDET